MKILIVNQHPQDVVGGSEIQCSLIASSLSESGHDVIYLALNGSRSRYDASYTVVTAQPGFQSVKQALLVHRPDVVYWRFNRRKFLESMLACKQTGTKVVYAISSFTDLLKWSHRINFQELSWKERIRIACSIQFLRHLLAMRVNYVGFYLTDGIIAQLQSQTGRLPAKKEIVIQNSIAGEREDFSWPKPYVAWVGSVKGVKNPETYLELAQQVQRDDVDFLLVGDIKNRYKERFQPENLPPNFYCLGLKSNAEVNGILRHALFVVQTSYVEGFPNVLIQAWMQGKPTIGLFYDPDDMIATQQLGYVSGNFAQCVKDTQTLIDNETLRQEIGQRAYAFAASHFNREQNMRKLESFLQEIIDS
ncbi:hypothetical protein CSA56_00020 [candidate division KSB3 bacterium]|uniref:Glycosyl transferase family 1 domain-containing protein n=1 Tax=candidate division KSB3 bacterium TaxID=2044937 RepID=A0A2G6KNE4_9BACT|nr:MAG: hypothetical protein CSA56_00020 [candidate division KSB3 bacterium]